MKLTDYVIDFLARQGIDHVFGLTGGGVVHLFDSADKHPGLKPVFCHHEQAAALAGVAYARIRNTPGAVIVTTGPAGTNALTAVLSAWQDSIPCLFISGQARREHASHGKRLRQLGIQEHDIVTLVRPITKYAVMVEEAGSILYHLEKALHLAKEGRGGPVWLDIPLDMQWAEIDPESLSGFSAGDTTGPDGRVTDHEKSWEDELIPLLEASERPLVLAGYGIRLAHGEEEFSQFIKTYRMPFISTWTASDLIETQNSLYTGRLGTFGQRGGNLAVQNCDLLIAIGSHLSIPLTGTMFKAFARDAKIVMVDIDRRELEFETVPVDLPVHCDAARFLSYLLHEKGRISMKDISGWQETCRQYKRLNDVPGEWKRQQAYVNPYVFMEALSGQLHPDDFIAVDGGGTNMFMSFQGLQVKEGQRLTLSASIGSMGTGLPESIGVCFAHDMKRTICLSGDGSMQLNIQELQTMVHHGLPIKIFLLNNQGYLAIRHTQGEFLKGHYIGSSAKGGLSLPDFGKIAAAYGLKTGVIQHHSQIEERIEWALAEKGPVLVQVMISPDQELIPRQGFVENKDGTFSPRPLEDMAPYLDRDEFLSKMMVKPLPVSLKNDA